MHLRTKVVNLYNPLKIHPVNVRPGGAFPNIDSGRKCVPRRGRRCNPV